MRSISAGHFRTCAITGSGSSSNIWCWGWNGSGALGDGTTTDRPLPSPVCSAGSVDTTCTRMTNAFSVVTGRGTTCARGFGGSAYCWGANGAGQLGLWNGSAFVSDFDSHPNPAGVRDPANTNVTMGVSMIVPANAESGNTTCAIRASDQVELCWGGTSQGILGRNSFSTTLTGRETPAPVCRDDAVSCTALTGSAVGVGYYHACAISADKVRCWGGNGSGQLGDGTETNKSFAGNEVALGEPAVGLAVSEFHSCALLLSGKVMCWGWSEALGIPQSDDSPVPVAPQ